MYYLCYFAICLFIKCFTYVVTCLMKCNKLYSLYKKFVQKQLVFVTSYCGNVAKIKCYLSDCKLALQFVIRWQMMWPFFCFSFVAFSWFAFCEYVIASANMAFHVTVILDFPTEKLLVAKGLNAVRNKSPIKEWKAK